MHYNIKPDIVVTAKGLGNGYPISCVTINSNIIKGLKDKPLNYLQSHINDPLGCAISLEVIRIIEEENLIENSQTMGDYFKNKLEWLKDKHSKKIIDIRCRGLLIGIELSKQINGSMIFDKLFEKGFIVGFKLNVIRLLPPLIIKTKDIDELIDELDNILIKTSA